MNNNGWQQARYEARLPLVRVHDLRHSFACRLRAAGVTAEDREALLGHGNHSMAGHYASADVGHLLKQANLVLNRSGTRTVLRVADGSSRRTVGVNVTEEHLVFDPAAAVAVAQPRVDGEERHPRKVRR